MSNYSLTFDFKGETQSFEKAINKVQAGLAGLNKETEGSDTALGKVKSSLATVGGKLTGLGAKFLPVTAAIGALGTAAVKVTADFDVSMSQVKATMDLTEDSMMELNGETVSTIDAMTDLARQLGRDTKFSAGEAADAINIFAMAGLEAQQIYDALPVALNLAAAGSISIAEASDYATGILAGFSMEAEEAGKVADILARISTSAKGSVSDFGAAMVQVAGEASGTGQSIEDVAAALGILGNYNIAASEGGHALQRVLKNLYKPTDTAKKAMQELGVAVYDAEGNARPLQEVLQDMKAKLGELSEEDYNSTMSSIFDAASMNAAGYLIKDCGEQFDTLREKIDGAAGAAERMAEVQQDNLIGQLEIVKSQLAELGISFGEILMPTIREVVDWVSGLIDKLNGLDEGQKKTIVTIGLIVAAIGPVLMILGSLATAISALLNPVGAVVVAVAAVVTAFTILYSKCEWFRNAVKVVVDAFVKDFEKTKEELIMVGNAIVTAWEFLSSIASAVWSGISGFVTRRLDSIMTAYEEHGGGMTGVTAATLTFIKDNWEDVFNAVDYLTGGKLSDVVDTIRNKLGEAWDFVKSGLDKIKSLFDFDLEFPKIKMPHFSITGSFSLSPPSVPKLGVEFYAKAMDRGMILNGPTVFGFNRLGQAMVGGEAGSETIVGTGSLMSMVSQAALNAVDNVRSAEIDPEMIYAAVREGASDANLTLQMGDRAFRRYLMEMGVSFA